MGSTNYLAATSVSQNFTVLPKITSSFIDLDSVYERRRHASLHKKTCEKSGKCLSLTHATTKTRMVMQIHLMIMRVHNKLMWTVFAGPPGTSYPCLLKAYEETLFVWQSVLIHNCLPKILCATSRRFLSWRSRCQTQISRAKEGPADFL